ncbi:SusC/RagA family TonB-linked outer membrane protein [Salegentibacter sp. F188]|uniref:SusC/RagA family TonB-linked outer membrane protein n=1 Tax=Autumnicola patrickiae TaxID=3075591 RepID=A0ABU3DYX0_9FLAO|nr:SusC/RagA family TonB-linked outer membrane protein [Salegentibacter sp. F188]MDT0688896.1 SusC/RagA family TonB-linked outer membrane protein [Salegentibacter sp. F188]
MKRNKWIEREHGSVSFVFFLLMLVTGFTMQAQDNITVTGTVIEADTQAPLPGVTIVQEGTSNGTATDFDGNFSITVPSDAVLLASFIGYRTEEIAVDGQEYIQFILQPDLEAMDEIVVVGYGTLKKTDLTGSVSSVSSEDLTERNLTNPLEALQGNMPGVQITTSTGRIGDGFDIVVRGKNSMGGNVEPLYIVDGVPANDIDFLNPQDIDRIDVLKDASSTAIYGSRGSNGVVIVTTKSGASAKPGINISFENFVGIKEVARLPEMMDSQTWWDYHQSAYLATAGTDPVTGNVTEETLFDAVIGDANAELLRRATENDAFDWYDAVLQSGIQQNSYLNISGTADNGLGYNLGLGYQKETGNVENESLEKYSFKAGLNHQINDKFTAGANLTVALTEQNLGSDLAMREAFRLNPFLTPYGLDGELFPMPGKLTDENGDFLINKTSTYNPILEISNSADEIRRWNMIGNTYFQYDPIEWLSLKTTFSVGVENNRRGRSWGAMTNRGVSNNNLPSADMERLENFNYTWDNQFNINHTINDDHAFNLLGLFSMYSNRTESSFGSSRNMPFDTGFYNIGSGEQSTFNVGSNFMKQTLTSYALRLNYGFLDRYLITLSNRWDGSSLLSEENRWDSFPSGAIAWRISEEAFLRNQETISNLKARLSYGFTGNNIIAPYSTLNTLDTQTFYDFNGNTANGWLPANIANSQLGWEKTREVNFGVDFGFFHDRITGSVDVYDRLSDDLLLQQQLPLETGWASINANVGSVSNKGVEVALTTRNIQTEDVTWTTSFTFTKNTNSIESIYGQDVEDDIGNNLFIGESIDAHYNYRFTGIWQADEADEAASYGMEEGQEKILDVNGDGRYTPDGDRIILGSSDPKWSGSIFSSLKVGNFDLSASAITNQGVFVYSPFHSNFADTRDRGRQKLDIDWYVPANDAGLPARASNTHPQPRNEGSFWRNDGVGYYKDASFIKVKNIALGYTFADNINDRLDIDKLRIYANVLNPFVFTDYEGYDPEWAQADLGIGRVSSITYQLGFSLKF